MNTPLVACRSVKRIALLLLLAGTLALAVSASGASAASGVKSCSTPNGFMAGPFFADGLRVRAATCANGRKLVGRWGRTSDCVMPRGGPSDKTCRVGRYRCTYRQTGGEESAVSRTTCKRRGTRKAVGFNFGS